ncbi:hypothetical protein BV25DRAFT_935387 [Artomyces pyxidatus]|uniref:Uncharacterized protein n=1 Tax=Artomyces pyxidatus TaxID=48021 RepID=A0ACB8SWD3_9AGAM|nr:hypothetical protein BV25DRAFT_935387 [Artomyces pyxidatus]
MASSGAHSFLCIVSPLTAHVPTFHPTRLALNLSWMTTSMSVSMNPAKEADSPGSSDSAGEVRGKAQRNGRKS